jgi:hypothetical protein
MSHLKTEISLLRELLTVEVVSLSKKMSVHEALHAIYTTLEFQNMPLDILKDDITICIAIKFPFLSSRWEIRPLDLVDSLTQKSITSILLMHNPKEAPLITYCFFEPSKLSSFFEASKSTHRYMLTPKTVSVYDNYFLLFDHYIDFRHGDPKVIKVIEKIIYISFLFQLEKYRDEEVRVLALTSSDPIERQCAELFCKQEIL